MRFAICSEKMPKRRGFIPLPASKNIKPESEIIRVQQFNVLADGLSGKRDDLGGFSRASREVLDWDNRKEALLHEIVQYNSDIVTLQECDHFHDFFQPRLSTFGYAGYFAAKPTSGCLEVSGSADGCAIFVKKDRFRVKTCESKSLALSIAKLKEGELIEENSSIKAQNQIFMIAVLEFIGSDSTEKGSMGKKRYDVSKFNQNSDDTSPPARKKKSQQPPLIISTAHLKSSKTGTGERYRQKGILKILAELDRVAATLGNKGREPAIILSGDLNAESKPASDRSKAVTWGGDYAPLTWNAIAIHSLDLKSVYDYDARFILKSGAAYRDLRQPYNTAEAMIPERSVMKDLGKEDMYTTWKARKRKGNREVMVKRSIDYIFYAPFRLSSVNPGRKESNKGLAQATLPHKAATANSPSQVVISLLLRTVVYTFGGIIPIVAIIDSTLTLDEKVLVCLLGIIGLSIFEVSSQGTVFRPQIRDEGVIESIDSDVDATHSREVKPGEGAYSSAGRAFQQGKTASKELLKGVQILSKRVQTTFYRRPGVRPVALLDLYTEDDLGESLLPSTEYPSDHLSIIADFEVLW